MKLINLITCLICVINFGVFLGVCEGKLRKNFYKTSCPTAEAVIKKVTESHVAKNASLPAKLLRMHFHDCFVRGCDASLLIDPIGNATNTEKNAIPNLTIGGYEVIDDAKAQLEKICPGVVSCADIVTLASRDSVSVQFNKPMWEVLTGRRDGNVSSSTEALTNIPAPSFNFTTLKQSFAAQGLNKHDLVVLSGGHTIGIGHCSAFATRIYNFTGKGDTDPALNSTYAAFLRTKCTTITDRTTTVEMDPNSSLNFDTNYYTILKQNKGLFTSDAALLNDKGSRNIIEELTSTSKFLTEFAQSMKRMGAIGVLTGKSGEIRKNCRLIN